MVAGICQNSHTQRRGIAHETALEQGSCSQTLVEENKYVIAAGKKWKIFKINDYLPKQLQLNVRPGVPCPSLIVVLGAGALMDVVLREIFGDALLQFHFTVHNQLAWQEGPWIKLRF